MMDMNKPSSLAEGKGRETELTVGAEIREVRKARGMTLKELSERTGRSVAYLSRIERGETRISVDLLGDIGEALRVDPKWFFPTRSGAGDYERSYVVKADARRLLSGLYKRTFEELGFEDDLLSSTLTGQFYMVMSRYPPRAESKPVTQAGYVFEGEQHGVVIQGQIELTLGDEVIQLKTGDSFSYPNTIPHRFRNSGEEEAVVVAAIAPVTITW